jgi:electron transport complex protein RnfC
VTGNGVAKPQNFYTLIGTPFSHLIEAAGGYRKFAQRLLMGGPMMGFQLKSDQVPVVKATNCILVSSEDQLAYSDDLAMPCIRCGKCAEVCPVDLLPQQLYWYARSENHPRAEQHHLFNCIECGCCSYVCPSRIPLVQYYRHAKAQIREQRTLKDNAELARQRFEFREFRQQREKEERAAMRAAHKRKVRQKMANNGDKKAAILAAMARAKAKKAALAKAKQSTDQNSTKQK